MSERIFVRPAKGKSVPDLDESPAARIPPEGKFVSDTAYIRRRIAEGSLELVEQDQQQPLQQGEQSEQTVDQQLPEPQQGATQGRRRGAGASLPPITGTIAITEPPDTFGRRPSGQ